MALPSVTSDHANVNVAPIKGLRLVANGVEFAAGSEGDILHGKRDGVDVSVWFWNHDCSGGSDFTWRNVPRGLCLSAIDGNGNHVDMYSVRASGPTGIDLYHSDNSCSGKVSQRTDSWGCAQQGDKSIKSLMLINLPH